jgi:hypothetical protein
VIFYVKICGLNEIDLFCVKTRRLIHQTITLLLASMLLLMAGMRPWSEADSGKKPPGVAKSVSVDDQHGSSEDTQPQLSSLLLDAVITPAVSFDFYQHFHFLPQVVWHFVPLKPWVSFRFAEPFFLVTGFARIFGVSIVTNAP